MISFCIQRILISWIEPINAFFSHSRNECTDMVIRPIGENFQTALDDTKVGFDLESFESTHDVYYSAKDVTQGLK